MRPILFSWMSEEPELQCLGPVREQNRLNLGLLCLSHLRRIHLDLVGLSHTYRRKEGPAMNLL